MREDAPEYLLITGNSPGEHFIFPQGHLKAGETPATTAHRETAEEAGVESVIESDLGFFLHEINSAPCMTHIFSASFSKELPVREDRIICWCTFEEAMKLPMHREGRRCLQEFHSGNNIKK